MAVYAYENLLSSCSQIANKFRTSKFLTTISNLFTRLFKIELQTAKLYCLHIISLLLNSSIRKRLTMKSRELSCDLFNGNASNP